MPGFIYTSIPYLDNAKAEIDADIQIDNTTSKYTFKTESIKLNNLNLNAEGFFQLVNDSTYNMDIKFKTPSNEFKDILSLIPGIYKKDFDKIKTSGQAAFNGFVKGTYSPQQMPAYDVNLEVKDGFFQYPDLPKPVKNIQLAMHASNPDGKTDNAVIDISKGHVEMDNEPFDFKLLFKNPETIQYIDAVAKGKLDLANVTKFVKLDQAIQNWPVWFGRMYLQKERWLLYKNSREILLPVVFLISKIFSIHPMIFRNQYRMAI